MNTHLLVVTSEQKDLVKKTIAPDATDAELELFFHDNKRRGVHPLDRLIHFTKRKGRYVPVTSIHFMRAKADEGGRAGQDQPVFAGQEGMPSYECAVTVYKFVNGAKVPYIGVAKWKEFYPGDGDLGFMWRKMPSHMLAKCAEANALRLAFPRELAGLHVEEEVHVLDEQPDRAVLKEQIERPSLKDKLKAQLEPTVEPDGAWASASKACEQLETQARNSAASVLYGAAAPITEQDNPATPWVQKIRNASTTVELNRVFRECPDELKQDINIAYLEAMKGLVKK